jgi:low temperature requirement protein LtrA
MKMKQYDEYQKLIRYKYGYYSFISLIGLIILNYFLGLFPNLQWGATREIEMLIIIGVVILFFGNISVYHHAYFRKNDNKKINYWLFLAVG